MGKSTINGHFPWQTVSLPEGNVSLAGPPHDIWEEDIFLNLGTPQTAWNSSQIQSGITVTETLFLKRRQVQQQKMAGIRSDKICWVNYEVGSRNIEVSERWGCGYYASKWGTLW